MANNIDAENNTDTANIGVTSAAPAPVALPYARSFPDVSIIEIFANENFKCWQERIFSLLDVHGVAHALLHPQPSADVDNKIVESWQYANKVCRHTILQTISNELFDVYCSYKEAKAIWEALIKKFTTEDSTKQKFVVGKFYQWQMRDDKEMNIQINEFQKMLEDLKAERVPLPEKFVAGVLIEKLLDSWSDYKNNLKHKQKNFTIEEIVTHILIEDSNRKESAKARMTALKANLVQNSNNNRKRYENKSQGCKPKNPNLKRKKGSCFVCGKPSHHASRCKYRERNDKEKTNTHTANLAEGCDIIAAVISQVNIVAHAKEWVIDSGATRYIYANREAFSSYTPLEDDKEEVYLGDSCTTKVLGKGKLLLKLFGKNFSPC
ncbi:uncharacterized protein LOC107775070 [Nicotiana tabacum]|uniref:Uncharacterized protein LOC107775070 n=2 Tax=Nicotiana TaxID=4085 RepID=A0A1S3YE03_TOBAC|nr:PREDICTED: uncharacterized protein LOC104222699 [Nicotiana sylvestris]XP_016450228.1 PREDICTED: uncharacterized protein LOC107775070 [Nicotiana tabacum]